MNIILDLPRDHSAACSFLRQSLALSLIHEYAVFSGPSNTNSSAELTGKLQTFALLAIRDPDACATALREAARISSIDPVYASQTAELLAKVSAKLLFEAEIADMEVQDAAQEVLKALFSQGAANTVRGAIPRDLEKTYLPSSTATPLFSDKRLILQGALLNFRAEGGLHTPSLAEDFKGWVWRVRNALQEANVSRISHQIISHQ